MLNDILEDKWICIKDNEDKGFIKGEILTIIMYCFERSYSSSPFPNIQDDYQTPPFCPPERYIDWTIYDKNNMKRNFEKHDIDEYFILLKDKRNKVIKKLLE